MKCQDSTVFIVSTGAINRRSTEGLVLRLSDLSEEDKVALLSFDLFAKEGASVPNIA